MFVAYQSPVSYSAPGSGAEYCDERVCLCFRLSAIISSKRHRPIFTNFLCMLPMAVARSCSGGVVIGYVLPVLWMTLYLFDVTAKLKRSAHSALGLVINCAQ